MKAAYKIVPKRGDCDMEYWIYKKAWYGWANTYRAPGTREAAEMRIQEMIDVKKQLLPAVTWYNELGERVFSDGLLLT